MKIRVHWRLHLLFLVVSVLGTRTAWQLSLSQTGWTPHLDQWVNVAASLVGIERQHLSDRDAAEQATFWLREVERIESANDDPQLALGAAWILDAPQYGFISRHVRLKKDPNLFGLPVSWQRTLDDESITALSEEFESACREECLAQIERAVHLDETNVELRRAHALILFQTRFMSRRMAPRQDNWLSVLDECAQFDPDNALYDYLAALHLWKSSADYDWDEEDYFLNIDDEDRFEKGNVRLAVGLKKPYLKFGTDGYAATFRFLTHTSILRSDYVNTAGSRHIESRATGLLYRIMRWKSSEFELANRADRFDAAADAVQHVHAISEQVTDADNYPDLLIARLTLKKWSLANLENIHLDHPTLLNADEAADTAKQLAAARLEFKILEEIAPRMADKAPMTLTSPLLMTTVQTLVVVCSLVALLLFLFTVMLGKKSNTNGATNGWLSHLVAWALAISLSFIAQTILPADETGGLQLTPEDLQNAVPTGDTGLVWTLFQWHTHHGPIIAAIFAAAILTVWCFMQRATQVEGGLSQVLRSQKRSVGFQSCKTAAVSCAVATILFLIVYLQITPAVVNMMDTYHQVHSTRMSQPATAWTEIAELKSGITSDNEIMTQLHAEIDKRNRQIAEQRSWKADDQ